VPVCLLILESFGTSELLVILVVALIFFGPRKLPQLSRQIGKSLAEFRKASEDFKRTWEREVALETVHPEPEPNASILPLDNSIGDATVGRTQAYNTSPEEGFTAQLDSPSDNSLVKDESLENSHSTEPAQSTPTQKRDWL
jgi:Tat protein translocase TatB subunit